MKKLAFISMLALGLLTVPAAAGNFLGVCKANPTNGSSRTVNDKWCMCVDKETAGNKKIRAIFLAAFKIHDLATREALSSNASYQTIGHKCADQKK